MGLFKFVSFRLVSLVRWTTLPKLKEKQKESVVTSRVPVVHTDHVQRKEKTCVRERTYSSALVERFNCLLDSTQWHTVHCFSWDTFLNRYSLGAVPLVLQVHRKTPMWQTIRQSSLFQRGCAYSLLHWTWNYRFQSTNQEGWERTREIKRNTLGTEGYI